MRKRGEGYLLIDHSASPGLSEEFMRANNLKGPVVPGGRSFESSIYTCPHCSRDILMHHERTRDRSYCFKCDSYICDNCGLLMKLGGDHVTYQSRLDSLYTAISNGKEPRI